MISNDHNIFHGYADARDFNDKEILELSDCLLHENYYHTIWLSQQHPRIQALDLCKAPTELAYKNHIPRKETIEIAYIPIR